MKLIFTFIFLTAILSTKAQQKGNKMELSIDKSSITMDSLQLLETEFNFGRIPQGRPVNHTFIVKNAGLVPFGLESVQASCGCTTPEWNKEIIQPGHNSTIIVGYNAASEGAFNKTITINYNKNDIKIITIKGEVWKTPLTSAPVNAALENLKTQL